jgi:hypothetical protein
VAVQVARIDADFREDDMRISTTIIGLLAAAAVVGPALAWAQPVVPVAHDEMGGAFDELVGQLNGLGDRLRGHVGGPEGSERPLVTIMLDRREELGLSPGQVKELERIRMEFQREAIKLDADQRVAQMDLAALLQADHADMGRVEAKVREIERLRADLRLGRIRAIEQGKAQLTAEQRSRLQAMVGEPRIARPRPTPSPYTPPPPQQQRF